MVVSSRWLMLVADLMAGSEELIDSSQRVADSWWLVADG